jgi:hypothetical protein
LNLIFRSIAAASLKLVPVALDFLYEQGLFRGIDAAASLKEHICYAVGHFYADLSAALLPRPH